MTKSNPDTAAARQDPWRQAALPSTKKRPPWWPSEEDCAFTRAAVAPLLEGSAHPVALVLGVTPDLVGMDWPDGTSIIAVDSSPRMIDASWKPHPSLSSQVLCARWEALPIDDESVDVAVGDGSLNALPSSTLYEPVLAQVARVLRPGGLLVLRCFVKRPPLPSPAELVTAALRGEFPSTSAFRMPFAMSVAGDRTDLPLAELPARFDALVPDRDRLAEATGWPRSDIDFVDADIGTLIRLNFPTIDQLLAAVERCFDVEAIRFATYTQARHCPTLILRRC